MDFALSNGMDGLALTDHGNMNGFAHQMNHADKLKKGGVKFKAIPGVEAYFHPSLTQWRRLKDETKAALDAAKFEKDHPSKVGNEMAEAEAELQEISDGKTPSEGSAGDGEADSDEDGGTIVENEEESKGGNAKSNKARDPLKQRSHLVLLPKNSAGLNAIFNLVSDSAADGFYMYPRVDFDMINKHAKGNVIALTACIAGYPAKIVFDHQTEPDWKLWVPNRDNFEKIQDELCKSIEEFQHALGGKENYFLEMQFNKLGAQHLVNMHLIEAAKRTGAQLVVTCDAHYSHPDHWREREIYKAIGWQMKGGASNDLPQSVAELKCELYPKNAKQVWDSYKFYCEGHGFYDDTIVKDAIERTHDIAHQLIGDVQPNRSVKLPAIEKLMPKDRLEQLVEELGEGADEDALAFRHLKDLVVKGVKWRKKTTPEYLDRLKYELEVVKVQKFAKYFVTYAKIMELLAEHMLIGNARGSAGGSLLAYVLNITQMDPIKHGLLFERFMTRKKKAFPDIDSDFGDRKLALKIIAEYFGEENVIPVSNFAQLQIASLCKDLARIFNVPFDMVNSYTGKMRAEAMAEAKKEPGFDAQVWEFTLEVAKEDSPSYGLFMKEMEAYPEFKGALDVLFKQQRTVSRHAGGIIITDNTRNNMPLIKAKGGLQTPWAEGLNGRYLEDLGFLKFDILGLGTLRMFEDCIRKILIRHHGIKHPTFAQVREYFDNKLHPDVNPMDDMKVFKNVFWDNRYAGVFQFVQKNTQSFMAQMKPTSVLDIAIATSIFRPGPLGLKADKLYLNNRLNPTSIEYEEQTMEQVLGPTAGLLIFQEQLQLLVHKLAGWHLDDTDAVRKAFTKKDKAGQAKIEKEREDLRVQFVSGAKTHLGMDEQSANNVWADFSKWTAYGFNKSHAMAYAITTYQCAWFLTYYPDEWITTYIDYCTTEKGKVNGKEDPKVVAMSEARRLGYSIVSPDLNNSEFEFTIDANNPKVLIPGFASLKNVGKSALYEIKRFRPYTQVQDLLIDTNGSWRHSKFNKRALGNLIKLEALESMKLVGNGSEPTHMFRTYREAHDILVDGYDTLKRISARKKNNDVTAAIKKMVEDYRAKFKEPQDWTNVEKIKFNAEIAGYVDMDLLVKPAIKQRLEELNLDSIDAFPLPDPEDTEKVSSAHWAIIRSATIATAKNGPYLLLKLFAETGQEYRVNSWGWKGPIDKFVPNAVIAGVFDFNPKFGGFTVWKNKLFIVDDKA